MREVVGPAEIDRESAKYGPYYHLILHDGRRITIDSTLADRVVYPNLELPRIEGKL
jgi:hypothetical protein